MGNIPWKRQLWVVEYLLCRVRQILKHVLRYSRQPASSHQLVPPAMLQFCATTRIIIPLLLSMPIPHVLGPRGLYSMPRRLLPHAGTLACHQPRVPARKSSFSSQSAIRLAKTVSVGRYSSGHRSDILVSRKIPEKSPSYQSNLNQPQCSVSATFSYLCAL